MLQWFLGRLRYRPAYRVVSPPQPRRIVLTAGCHNALQTSLAPEIARRHEGIVYLLGQTDGHTSLAAAVFRPSAITTRGSFHVDKLAMRPLIDAASAAGLKVVGQLHTHPQEAYHSAGDEAGALIRFNGFVSIVLPDYGTRLPSLDGAAVYMFSSAARRFVQLWPDDFSILREQLP